MKQFQNLLIAWIMVITFISCDDKTTPPKPLLPVPSEKQLAWHKLEMYAFVHFTTNTFTGKEWGFGDENPDIFNPTELNTDQWAKIIKEAGLTGIVLTCKHHDGFCLWPCDFTGHSVKSSSWKDGNGDIVKEVRESCDRYGLKFGIYLSPWDRNRADYGTPSYIEYYRNQLRELFTRYGPVFEMWFDGANGGNGFYGGSNENRRIDGATYYDWPNTIRMVLEMEPEVLFFSDAGPDIRWCGNESGFVGETNWCMMDTDTIYAGKPGISSLLNQGSENGKHWLPAEVDVSIRPGWFYHPEEDSMVKSPEKLFDIYLTSVGRGANLILNIPPDRRGLLHENDVKSLLGWKKLIDQAFAVNLAKGCRVTADSFRGKSRRFAPSGLVDDDPETYWATEDSETKGSLTFDLGKSTPVKYVAIQEYIRLGQRIRSFNIEACVNGAWVEIAQGTTVGYKRIISFEKPAETRQIRINILDSRACPVVSNVEIY